MSQLDRRRRVVSLALALACLAAPAAGRAGVPSGSLAMRATPAPVEAAPVPVPLHYTHRTNLPFGIHLDLTPGLVVARDARHLGALLGYSGTAEVSTYGDLLVLAGRVESRVQDDGLRSEWSIQMTLGKGVKLPARAIALHVLGHARSVLARVL